jgi:hypothetical protein
VDGVHLRAGDRSCRSMTNGRALVVAHHRKSRAERVIGVESRLATRLAPRGRVEGAIEDGPGPISGWGDQNPQGQPQAHSRSALVAHMLAANSSTPLRSGARSCSCATTPSRCKARRNETFPESSMEAPAAAAPALGARERIARARPTRPARRRVVRRDMAPCPGGREEICRWSPSAA